ncbi:hypothetical protein C8J57DRAFT_1304519 [Mycena rebaudengoi]|nr:hypothetical protein C8J57DRAFT_1304519 [Mycena rebaudengoi]
MRCVAGASPCMSIALSLLPSSACRSVLNSFKPSSLSLQDFLFASTRLCAVAGPACKTCRQSINLTSTWMHKFPLSLLKPVYFDNGYSGALFLFCFLYQYPTSCE